MLLQCLFLTEDHVAQQTGRLAAMDRLVILIRGIALEKAMAYGTLLSRKSIAACNKSD